MADRLRRIIDPNPPAPDPEGWVLVGVVAFSAGPMCRSALEGAGIEVQAVESSGLYRYAPNRTSLLVRARDLDRATEIVDEVAVPLPGPLGVRRRRWTV